MKKENENDKLAFKISSNSANLPHTLYLKLRNEQLYHKAKQGT